jgi:hypothetical protein
MRRSVVQRKDANHGSSILKDYGQKHAYEEQMIQATTKNRFDCSVRYSHCGTDWAPEDED